jgi:hypothetical protein
VCGGFAKWAGALMHKLKAGMNRLTPHVQPSQSMQMAGALHGLS